MTQTSLKTISLASGQPVYAPVAVIDERELIALQLLGPEESVKANWAVLMSNRTSYHVIAGNGFSIKGKQNHVVLRKLLPCGWLEMWLLHKQACFPDMSPAAPSCYLLHLAGKMPDFYLTLNKALAVPLLPDWRDFLWRRGQATRLVKTLPRTQCRGASATAVVLNQEKWQKLISHGLTTKQIAF